VARPGPTCVLAAGLAASLMGSAAAGEIIIDEPKPLHLDADQVRGPPPVLIIVPNDPAMPSASTAARTNDLKLRQNRERAQDHLRERTGDAPRIIIVPESAIRPLLPP